MHGTAALPDVAFMKKKQEKFYMIFQILVLIFSSKISVMRQLARPFCMTIQDKGSMVADVVCFFSNSTEKLACVRIYSLMFHSCIFNNV